MRIYERSFVRMQNIPSFVPIIDVDFIHISIIHDNTCKLSLKKLHNGKVKIVT